MVAIYQVAGPGLSQYGRTHHSLWNRIFAFRKTNIGAPQKREKRRSTRRPKRSQTLKSTTENGLFADPGCCSSRFPAFFCCVALLWIWFGFHRHRYEHCFEYLLVLFQVRTRIFFYCLDDKMQGCGVAFIWF